MNPIHFEFEQYFDFSLKCGMVEASDFYVGFMLCMAAHCRFFGNFPFNILDFIANFLV